MLLVLCLLIFFVIRSDFQLQEHHKSSPKTFYHKQNDEFNSNKNLSIGKETNNLHIQSPIAPDVTKDLVEKGEGKIINSRKIIDLRKPKLTDKQKKDAEEKNHNDSNTDLKDINSLKKCTQGEIALFQCK
jgi:hypothetical protein